MNLAATYEIATGDNVRLFIQHGSNTHPILWFQVDPDASLYLGPRYKKLSVVKKGIAMRAPGKASVSYADGTPVTDPEVIKRAKLSFHGSGVITAAGDHFRSDALRQLTRQEQLCVVIYQHPTRYVPVKPARKRDVIVPIKVDDERPLHGMVGVAPPGQSQLIRHQSAVSQINLIFEVVHQGTRLLDLQIVLAQGPKGLWPPYTYILFKAKT